MYKRQIFTRESLSRFDSEFVDTLTAQYIELLSDYVNNEKCLYEYGLFLPEALSRLCSRCSLETKDKILAFVLNIYQGKQTGIRYQGVDKLVQRLINSFSDSQLYIRLEEVTTIASCVVGGAVNNVDVFCFPNPFKYFLTLTAPIKHDNSPNFSNEIIKVFLKSSESENHSVRENATLTLIRLHQLGLLNKNQVKSLLSKLLSNKDHYGLPKNTAFYKFVYVEVFEKRKDIVEGLKAYLLEASPRIQANLSKPNSFGISGQPDRYTRELLGSGHDIDWSKEELHLHAKKLLKWWKSDKQFITREKEDSGTFDEMRHRFSLFSDCINLIIIQNNLLEYKKDIQQLVGEFEEYGMKYLYFKSISIYYLEIEKGDLIMEIEEALSSFDEESTTDAIWAIGFLIDDKHNIDPNLLQIFSVFIRYASNQRLISAFNIVLLILRRHPNSFNRSIEKAVMLALDKIINGNEDLSFDENLELREAAADLASHLNNYYKTQCIDVPKIITQWKEVCLSDNEFSEIKKQWKPIKVDKEV